MAQFFQQQQNPQYGASAQNLQFYPSGLSTPSQASYGYSPASGAGYGGGGGFSAGGFGGQPGVTGRMGEQGGLRTGWLAAFGTEGYEGEPPLLEELGINLSHVHTKTLAVLNPLARIDQHIMDDADLSGPVIFLLAYGTFLLLSGKVHFGYIYGLALLGSTSLHFILSMMSPPLAPSDSSAVHDHTDPRSMGNDPTSLSSSLTFPRSASVLGYCLLPLVLTSLVGIIMPMDSFFGYLLTSLAIVWCTYSSSAMFCAVGRMRSMRGLVAYPLALFYCCFGIMGIFSSRGSGSFGKN